MSVEVTRLPTGLLVVTDAMPHLETASLGVWVGSGSRDERPDEHGISHLLEHMAFKGTSRRTARQIAEEIEAGGGDLNGNLFASIRTGETSILMQFFGAQLNGSDSMFSGQFVRDNSLLRARSAGQRAARTRRAIRHPRRSIIRLRGAAARAECHRAGDWGRRGRSGRSHLGQAAGNRLH